MTASNPFLSTIFDPALLWLRPYVECAAAARLIEPGRVARVGRLAVVDRGPAGTGAGALPVGKGAWDDPVGCCWPVDPAAAGQGAPGAPYQSESSFEILIATASPLMTLFTGHEMRPLPEDEILDSLAHELAHTSVTEHGPAHESLTAQILAEFCALRSGGERKSGVLSATGSR